MNNQMISAVPPMGWNSWNTFYDKINDELIRSMADTMVEQGLLDAGYNYLILDDGWQARRRDSDGHLMADPEKFPHGMKEVVDYVHSKGLKIGIYSCCGTHTCGGYPGSFEHEFSDAQQFADWGIDYLKYDNCYRPGSTATNVLYRRISMALRSTGRDILLAACQWGTEDVHQWIRSSGAHTFRSTIDIQDSWNSIQKIALSQIGFQGYNGPDCFNDMDMLVVGMYGKGLNPETSIGGCTDEEYQTHFALWAMMNSPLIIGCDMREMTDATKKILLNKEVIALNQDPGVHSCYSLPVYGNPDVFVLVKPLANGDYAIAFFNFGDAKAKAVLNFWDMGLSAAAGYAFEFRDCISHEDLGLQKEFFAPVVSPHGCKVYRCRLAQNRK